MNILMLMMGGCGTRLGTEIPKQYIELNGVPIFGYILEKYNKLNCIDKIVIVSNKNFINYVTDWVNILQANKVASIVAGGENRSLSIINGLKGIRDFAKSDDIVLIHDETHPYVDEETVVQMIDAIKSYGGAIALANDIEMKVLECQYLNLKITYKRDLELLKRLLTTYFFKDFDYEKYKIKNNTITKF